MAQGEPRRKRVKHIVLSEFISSPDFQQLFSTHWCNSIEIKQDNLEIICKPFKVCRISNFLSSELFMDEIKNELLDVKNRRNCTDLFQYEQTTDFVNIDTENIQLLYKTFQTELAAWMERNTKIELGKMVSMSSACYYDTDYLLCHDDNMDDRRIAFILYLSKEWTLENGGTLDLFDTDEDGLPRNVVKSLVPQYNSLVFFEVADNSYHQVAEIISENKSRWSINGWFHGPVRESNRPPRPQMIPNFIDPIDIEVDLTELVSKKYLTSDTMKDINKNIEKDSFTFLADFFQEDFYEKVVADITSDSIVWRKMGPPDVRNYEAAVEDSFPEHLKRLFDFLKSTTMCELLKQYTELDLVAEEGVASPKLVVELQRWTKGCYTLISDKSAMLMGSNESDTRPEEMLETSTNSGDKDSKDFEEVSINIDEHMDTTPPPSEKEDDQSDEEILRNLVDNKNIVDIDPTSPQSNKEDEDNHDEMLKKMLQANADENIDKSLRLERDTDSEESDIGDYLSDPNDCSLECSDDEGNADGDNTEGNADDANSSEPGTLDVILQFHTHSVPEEHTIDYVDTRELDTALIHVPPKDNHLCIVYKLVTTCRFHKYVSHYCTDYFYNLICTYYPQ